MTNVTFQKENNDTINLIVDGIECGKLELASEGFNDFRIEKVHIDEPQRGNGFYKMLLISCFSILGAKTVRSEKRNYRSNPIYQAWTGEELEEETPVWITLNGEKLEFTI